MTSSAFAWTPDPATAAATNVGRFQAEHGIATFDDLVRRSIDEPEWFWDAVVRFLGLHFDTPYTQVLDTSDGIPWAKWFVGGRCNVTSMCVDAHADDHTADVLTRPVGALKRPQQ